MSKAKDISEQKFGRLTALERVGTNDYGKSLWKCKCDCGNETIVRISALTTGHTKSCGCLREDRSRERCRKHGFYYNKNGKPTRLYMIWQNMKARCNNSNNPAYDRYGGRGIKVCREWKKNFETFRNWAKNNGYSEKLEIDRINNGGNYEPDNCRWVTAQKQNNNKRNNHVLTFEGKTQTIAEWARELNTNYGTLNSRINDYNWSVEKTLTTPVQGGKE